MKYAFLNKNETLKDKFLAFKIQTTLYSNLKKSIIYSFFLFFITSSFCNHRTLYVDNFNNILGSPTKENSLLLFAKKNNFGTLILYQLNKVDKRLSLADPRKNNILAEFLSKAKLKYGIKKMGASGECASFFTSRIQIYNDSRGKKEEKFDIYNLEYEYWSGKASGDGGYYCINYLEENSIPCGRKGSFDFFIDNLKELKGLSKNSNHPIIVEAYVGYYNQNEIRETCKYADRLLIHAYGRTPKLAFAAAKKNLENLYKIKSTTKASVLFSTRMNHMGYWLKFDNMDSGENKFLDEMNSANIQLKKNLNIDGFSYHTYSYLKKSIGYYSYSNN